MLFALAGTSAQAQSLPPLEEYHVRAFGVETGLLSGDVRGIAQTPDGYIYIASGRGLARFDGYRFRRIELPAIRTNFLESMFVDGNGRLWFVTDGDLLGYFHDERFEPLPRAAYRVLRVSESTDGTVWFGTDAGLLRVTPGVEPRLVHFDTTHGLPSGGVQGMYEQPSGERVAIAKNRVLRLVRDASAPGGIRVVPFGPACSERWEYQPNPNGLWLRCQVSADRVRLVQLRDGRFTEFEHPPKGESLSYEDIAVSGSQDIRFDISVGWVRGIGIPAFGDAAGVALRLVLRGRDSTVWSALHVGHEGRDYLVRLQGNRLETVFLREHLDFKNIQILLEDYEGSLWVGTDRGLIQLSPRRVFAMTRDDGLADGFVVPVLQTHDRAVWVGTWGGGLHRFADGTFARRYTTRDSLPSDNIRALYESSEGTLWIGTEFGFAAIRDGQIVLTTPGVDEVRAFAETRDGNFWVGTSGQLFRRSGDRFIEFDSDSPATSDVWALHVARDGSLWLGGENGLARLAQDSLQTFDEADGLHRTSIMAIHEEKDGTLWFSTYERGLYRYRGGRFALLTTRNGLIHDGIWRILHDERGGMWMTSDIGVFRVDHQRLHAVANAIERGEEPSERLAPIAFTEANGLPNREFNRASPAGWRLDDGRLVFNNLEGLVVIDPQIAVRSQPPARAVIQEVRRDGELVPMTTAPRELPAGTRHLEFTFAALSFVAPDHNRYRYRLDGYDSDWVQGGIQPTASYTNLGPGRYTFRVQGTSGAADWSGAEASFAFALRPFLWQTWWFHASMAVLFGALLTAAYRYRVGRLLEIERVRLRIASDLHDDVGANLSSIALLSEMLQRHPRPDPTEERQLQRIRQAAQETIGALRDIIWIVDPKHDRLADVVERMRAVASDLLNGTAYTFRAPEAMTARPLGMTFIRNALLAYKETLHNVMRHAHAQRVAIEVIENNGRFVFHIQDDGVGFDESTGATGHGLLSMRRRAAQSGGHLEIVSSPGQGTRITFSAPLA